MAKKVGAVWKHGEYDTERITPRLPKEVEE